MEKKTSTTAETAGAAKSVTKPATKTAAKKKPAKAKTPTTKAQEKILVQYGASEYDSIAIAERCKAAYKADHKSGIHSCTVYIKPEDGMAYYVINKVSGKIEI